MDGAIVVDKPAGMTSHDVVAVARRLIGIRRIGHIGTLDPFATGVLVLLVGRATRLARFYTGRDKSYRGRIHFGFSTDTMDSAGHPNQPDRHPTLDASDLRRAFAGFVGEYQQHPPAFSAKKVSGVPAYRLARQGRSVVLAPSPVTIHRLDLLSVDGPFAEFEADVSSGTYVRALVNDLGERSGMGAHLAGLRRTRLGEFTEDDAVRLEDVCASAAGEFASLIPLEEMLPEIPFLKLRTEQVQRVLHGCDVEYSSEAPWLRVLDDAGRLCAMAQRIVADLYHPAVVLGSPQAASAGSPHLLIEGPSDEGRGSC
jgi:tRNA pseudouridine55 synthase